LPLKIIGDGPEMKRLKEIAGPTIEFVGSLPPRDKRMAYYLSQCKALIFPQEEDFGIVALEAMISGKPVIAYQAGGALEMVKENFTGLFFKKQTVESLTEAVEKFERMPRGTFDPHEIYKFALKFKKEKFEERIKKFILEKLEDGKE